MKLVQHPNVVRLYEVIDTQTKMFLILELADYDMYDYIIRHTEKVCIMDDLLYVYLCGFRDVRRRKLNDISHK
jgi:SNF-related kinase